MKLIRAYIRTVVIYDVIHALTKAGAQWMSVVNVMGLGDEMDPKKVVLSSEVGRYSEMAKLEFVCNEPCVKVAVDIIREMAASGAANDGIVIVTPVEEAISVKTGEKGAEVLCHLEPLSKEKMDELKREWE